MKKTVVFYGSSTGNTQTVANWVGEALSAAGVETGLLGVAKAGSSKISDLVVMGPSTWGVGEIQEGFTAFYDSMTAAGFGGKRVAVFGFGDNGMFPDNFCEAVDMIEQKARECDAVMVAEPFKVDGEIDVYKDEATEWAAALAQ